MSSDSAAFQRTVDQQSADLAALRTELEETNRGVVALYAELEDNALQLKDAAELKGRFLSYMSHEFRTPLASMISVTNILLDGLDGPLPAEQTRQLQFVQGSVRELSEMVDDLLLKEEFLATLSHELRNPLNAISGWASVLEHVPNLPHEVANAAAGIQRNCKLQANMISDLLDYAGITFGKMRVVCRVTPPYHAVRAALDIMQPIADASGVELQSTFEAEHLRVLADPERLQQIVWNLLSNAIKFSAKGAIVRIVAGRRGGNFRLTVQDYGAGISPEFLPRVFDRFSQGDATITRRHAGLGIGLAIVKQLVDMQHGTITAFSEGAGRGAKFTLELPLADVSTAVLGDSQRHQALSLAGAVVLLVEDDDDARELTSRILQEVGAHVIEARNAETALTRVIDGDANVLISDIGMANEDGYQLLREIRRRGYGSKRLPAIALTAFARMEDRESALAAGFQEHLVKPIEGQSLLSRIAELLRAP